MDNSYFPVRARHSKKQILIEELFDRYIYLTYTFDTSAYMYV